MKNYNKILINFILVFSSIYAESNIGADIVSRYVWRGTDYGNAAAIQPNIEINLASFTLGAWGSWSLSPGPYDATGNECDVYLSSNFGPVSISLTDYFFPQYNGSDSLFNLDKHTFELSGSIDTQSTSSLIALNILGDDANSVYYEFSYKALTIGVGNGLYTQNGKFMPISIGLNAQRDNLSVEYLVNPDSETSFLVFGINF